MNLNALTATIKSVLHTTGKYNREYSDTLARNIAATLANNWDSAVQHYGTSDMYDVAELVAKDYVRANS